MKMLNKRVLKRYSFFKLALFSIFFLLVGNKLSAQAQVVPIQKQFFLPIERQALVAEQNNHLAFKPIIAKQLPLADSLHSVLVPYFRIGNTPNKSFVNRKLFNDHLIQLDSNQVKLSIDALVNLQFGQEERQDPRDISLYKNMRGFRMRLDLGSKLSIFSSFRENQANLPLYLSRRTRSNSMAYGQGRVKRFNDGFDFNMASSRISYQAADWLNLQLGHDKHFIGHGHRSMLLSDLSFNYPFARLQSSWFNGKLNYQNLFAIFQDIERVATSSQSEGLFERKQGVFNYLSYTPNKKFQIGLFEGVIFPSLDSSGNIPVGANFYFPMLFLNTAIEGNQRSGNTLAGIDLSYRMLKQVLLYGQLTAFDEQLANSSTQLGVKWFANKELTFQFEHNRQAHQSSQSLFHHLNESLTHPTQESFSELLVGVYFQRGRWLSRLVGNQIETSDDRVQFVDFCQAYLLNPSNNFTINLGAQWRNSNQEVTFVRPQQESLYVYVGLSTNFQNLYFNY